MKLHKNVASCCQPPWMESCLAGWSHGRGSGGKRYAYECQLCMKRWAQMADGRWWRPGAVSGATRAL
eukprot:720824-Prymnesium_polylepis.1